jgi:hypothetical protein
MILKVYLTKEQYDRYQQCAEAEHRSLSNFAEYSMKRRADTGKHKAREGGED